MRLDGANDAHPSQPGMSIWCALTTLAQCCRCCATSCAWQATTTSSLPLLWYSWVRPLLGYSLILLRQCLLRPQARLMQVVHTAMMGMQVQRPAAATLQHIRTVLQMQELCARPDHTCCLLYALCMHKVVQHCSGLARRSAPLVPHVLR